MKSNVEIKEPEIWLDRCNETGISSEAYDIHDANFRLYTWVCMYVDF